MTKIQELLNTYKDISSQEAAALLEEIHFSDLLDIWPDLSSDEALGLFLFVPTDTKVHILIELDYEQQEHLIGCLSNRGLIELLKLVEPDDLVDIMQSVNKEVRQKVWESLSEESRREMVFLLKYDEDDAAGLMTPRYLAIQSTITVGQAIQFIRRNCTRVEFLFNLYVIDKLQRLIGVISIKELLSAPDSSSVSDLVDGQYRFVYDDTDQEEVAQIMDTSDLPAIPVINHNNVLIGIVTFDDVIDVIREEDTEDMYKMGAMSGSSELYVKTSILGLVKKRTPWILILLILGTITANVLTVYEHLIAGAAFLFIFMPVITQTGGNTGSQATTLMIRGLATNEIRIGDAWKIMRRECLVGVIMGVITGLVIFLRGMILPPVITPYESLVIAISLTLVVFVSNLLGIIAPLGIHKMGFDPTVMSTPLLATVIDVAGYAIYFETARLLLKL